MDAAIGVITETWLTDGESLDEDVEDLVLAADLKILYKNRKANDRGFSPVSYTHLTLPTIYSV